MSKMKNAAVENFNMSSFFFTVFFRYKTTLFPLELHNADSEDKMKF